MTTPTDQVSLREALEQLLHDNAATHPGFIERAVIDPKGTVEPMIAALLGDDGDLDMTDVNINIHVATPNSIHLVLSPEQAEVAGFSKWAVRQPSFDIGSLVLRPKRIGSFGVQGAACSGSDATCHTDSGETNYCGGCK